MMADGRACCRLLFPFTLSEKALDTLFFAFLVGKAYHPTRLLRLRLFGRLLCVSCG